MTSIKKFTVKDCFVHLALCAEATLFWSEELKRRKLVFGKAKQKLNFAIEELKPMEKVKDLFWENKEDVTQEMTDIFDSYMREVSSVKTIMDMKDVLMMLEAFRRDEASVRGLV